MKAWTLLCRSIPILTLALLPFWQRSALADGFLSTNLVTDDPTVNPAILTDPNMKNAWGISATAT